MLVRILGSLGVGVVLLLAWVGSSWGESPASAPPGHQHGAHHGDHAMPGSGHSEADAHAAHRAAMDKPRYAVSTGSYSVPDVELIDESGATVALRSLLDADQPVALNFIFTTCTTICPVMSATFAQMQRKLGEEAQRVQLVSISIDPEYDRPEVLRQYAERFHAGAGWTFLTGDGGDISQVLRSFEAYAGSKMNHQPITLLKKPEDPSWIRIDGLASGEDLAREVTARLLN